MFGFISFIKGMVAAIMAVLQLFFGVFFGDFTAPSEPLKDDVNKKEAELLLQINR